MRQIWVDGELGGRVPADDPALLLGLSVFETVRTYGDAPFRLPQHIARLIGSAAVLDISTPTPAEIEAEIRAVCRRDVRIRYTLTGGGRRIVDVAPIDHARLQAPVHVARFEWEPHPLLPGAVKHGSRAAWAVASRRMGVDEVLLVDRGGFILEASRSNVFAVQDGTLITPPLDGRLLAGVTRGAMLEAAELAGAPVTEAPLPVDGEYEELYLSSTLKQLAPVVLLDGRPAPGSGPVGAKVLRGFAKLVEREPGAPDISGLLANAWFD